MTRSGRLLAGFGLLAVVGCGPILYPVEGRVTVEGQTLMRGDVVLYPADGAKLPSNRVPQGTIGSDGVYRLTTGGRPGAPAGLYKVVVVAQTHERPKNATANPLGVYPLIAGRYCVPDTSPLRIEVGPEPRPGAYDLAVSH